MSCSEERKTDPGEWCDLHELPRVFAGKFTFALARTPRADGLLSGRGASVILNVNANVPVRAGGWWLMADDRCDVPGVRLLFWFWFWSTIGEITGNLHHQAIIT